ncbi:MAG: aspartate--tRNA(Asn) ligase [bacterium]
MQRTISNTLPGHIGETVFMAGWLHNVRILGKIAFLLLRDRGGIAQLVLETKEQINLVKDLQPGSVIEASGIVKEAKQAELGVEITNVQLKITNPVHELWPIEVNKNEIHANLETILDYRPLSLRNRRIQAVFKIQATLVKAYREILTKEDFVEFFGPNIIGASSEGGSELFKVKYFDNEAMLSQSAQLYKQIMVGAYERVFALMKCFRAEKSNTRRHITEATQFEFEMAFINSFEEVMDMLEKVVKYMVKTVKTECAKEVALLDGKILNAPEDVAFPRIPFHDAQQIYFERTGLDERKEIDLSPAAEKELCQYAREKFGTDFIFIPHFPTQKVAFYAKPNEKNPEVADYFDLLAGEAEITSGGQRINDHDELVESLKRKGLNPANFTDYLMIFKYGMPKHGGFGMGMERFTMQLLQLENVREATTFPSDTKRVASVPLAAKVFLGNSIGEEIVKRLQASGMEFQELHHEATPTSEDSARVRNSKLSEGVKAMILKGKTTGKNIMVNVPANQRVDLKKIAELEGEKFEFEKPEVIKAKFGLVVGSVPPFGNLLGLKTYFSKDIEKEPRVAFNRGSLTDSIVMQSKDLVKLIEPVMF